MSTTATPLNFQEQLISTGSIGALWANLSIPAPGSELILHTDGTPDATTNPDAFNLGLTEKGSTINAKATYRQSFADEIKSAVASKLDATEMTIAGRLLQIFDYDLLKVLTSGFGTYSTSSTREKITFGVGVQVYTSLALIFPQEEDPTKFAVFHLYKAQNESGLDSIEIASKSNAGTNFLFRGLAITSRVATDTVGAMWKQK